MKNQLWSAIYNIFQDMAKIHDQPQSYKSIPDEDGQMRFVSSGMDSKTLVKFRSELHQLDFLKAKLSENLTERETYLILYAVVVYFDEMIMYDILPTQHSQWPPFQKELFKIDNGGEVFYDTLEDLLRKPETPPFIYEVYYFCLSDGFKGKYVNDPVKIDEYKKKLQEKIPVPEITHTQEKKLEATKQLPKKWPYWLPALTIAFLVSVYYTIYLIAN